MAERGGVGPRDGIVVLELSLDDESGWEIPAAVGCLRAGAAALAEMPYRGSNVTGMLHARDVAAIGERIADELEAEARAVHDKREAFHRRTTKEREKASRAKR